MAGGYTVKKTIFRLKFADEEFAGCQVRVRASSVAELIALSSEITDLRLDGSWSNDMSQHVELLMETFAEKLVDWNLEEENEEDPEGEGTPIPATLAGLHGLEISVVVRLLASWLTGSAGVAPDLSEGSESGEPSLEASIPMEPLSPSQENSAKPS